MNKKIVCVVLYSLPGFIVGFLLCWSTTRDRQGYDSGKVSAHFKTDFNRDGMPDAFFYYSSNMLIKADYDRNFDNRLDYFEWYVDDVISRFEADDNFDGKIDVRGRYEFGHVAASSADQDFNGVEDVFFTYTNGVLTEAKWQPNGSTNIHRLQRFVHGVKIEELADTNGDGILDHRLVFGPFENVVEQRDAVP